MLKKICLILAIALLTTTSLFASEIGTINGRVIDGFGKPIPLASVTVAASGLKSRNTADNTGNFNVGYNTGNIKLIFEKEGYVTQYIPLSLDEGTSIPVGDIILWKIPPKGGLFVVSNNDYIEINSVEYYSEATSKERSFYVKGSPTVIKGQDIKIIDFQTDNSLVVGKTLYSIDPKGYIGRITFYPAEKYILNKMEETYTKIADNIGMRKLSLQPGKYFYCTGEITTRSKIGFGFFFEISS